MSHQRYSEFMIIQDAIESNLIDSVEDIEKFRFAHYRGKYALFEYYNSVPKSMMSIVFRPPRETNTRLLQKLANYQFDGAMLDAIITNESRILRDQIQYMNTILKFNSSTPILTKDSKYALPTHCVEKVLGDDSDYLKIRDVVLEELEKDPNAFRTRNHVEEFVKRNEHLTKLEPEVENRVDKLITYLVLRKIL